MKNPMSDAEKRDISTLWLVVLLSLILRSLAAGFSPLGVDEAYGLAVARQFSWSFFDHPPLGFWSPVFASQLFGIEHPFIYRIPALIYGSLSMVLLFAIGREIGGSRAGLWTAVLYGVSPMFFLVGASILPDGPLGVGSALAVLWLVRNARASGPVPLAHWALLGLGLAIALASKYQAALIPISTLVFMVVSPVGRQWFLRPGPYLAAAIGLIGLLPVLLWNLQNDWASFAFHGGRTGHGLNPVNLIVMVLGQFLYLLPPVLVLAGIGIWRGLGAGRADLLLLALIALGPILIFNAIYLISNKSFPHWTMPGWMFALPLAGLVLARMGPEMLARSRKFLIGFGVPMLALVGLALLHANTGFLTRFTSNTPPDWDQTQDLFDYRGLQEILTERGDLAGVELIATRSWITGGFMSWGLQGKFPVRVLGNPKHHFAFMTGANQRGVALLLDPQLLPGHEKQLQNLLKTARKIDPDARALAPIMLERGNIPYIAVNVVRLNFGP